MAFLAPSKFHYTSNRAQSVNLSLPTEIIQTTGRLRRNNANNIESKELFV